MTIIIKARDLLTLPYGSKMKTWEQQRNALKAFNNMIINEQKRLDRIRI